MQRDFIVAQLAEAGYLPAPAPSSHAARINPETSAWLASQPCARCCKPRGTDKDTVCPSCKEPLQ